MTEEEIRRVEIEWNVPDDLAIQYANNILIQATEHEVVISFYQAFPPMIMGTREEINNLLQEIKSIRANCVARIVVPVGQWPHMMKAFQTTLDRIGNQEEAE